MQSAAQVDELQRFCDEKADLNEKCREMRREKAKAAFTDDDVVILVMRSASAVVFFFT